MTKKRKKRRAKQKTGLPPGSLIYTGDIDDAANQFELFDYQNNINRIFHQNEVKSLLSHIDSDKKYWLQVEGINQPEVIQQIGTAFQINKLVLEDILDITQRPKCDVYDQFIFFTLKTFQKKHNNNNINRSHQISLILKDNLVIAFYEKKEKWMTDLVQKLQEKDAPIRQKSTDYLFYRIIDTIVDYYYEELENIEETIEDLELNIDQNVGQSALQNIQNIKRDLIYFRKTVFPLREAIALIRKDDQFISNKIEPYLSDVYGHIIHIIETIESYRDLTSGLMDLYMTGISNKMNEIMKVLTIIATIFIPLTFIAGLYGMNFKYMPELDFKWSYPATLLFMLLIAVVMILYFKRKKWF